jgi:hypothetical protein
MPDEIVPSHTRAERLSPLDDSKQRSEAARDRVAAQSPAKPVAVATRIALLLGIPLLVAIGIGLATGSIGFGVLGFIVALVIVVAIALRLTPAPPGPGTRAWESLHTMNLLIDVIGTRTQERATTADADRRARLDREIAFLSAQRDQHRAIVESGDRSAGRGFIGFDPYGGE